MSVVKGTLDQPLEDAAATIRQSAAVEGYSLAEGESSPTKLVFTKGVTPFSWGSHFAVDLEAGGGDRTLLTITTGETWAVTDWGRGGRAARKLLDAAGATTQ